ncbi:DNA sulfur modification protein DndD [Spirulina subsalsa FACHB-351]|uniref:Nuclease SbcCD subunit C n=1 Tax=Spirulina subsalsa FACHB-351 TaxID=234711 RepID=A0ABT3L6G7_9CYAN|nr:DNA sulfur modification protein DndD [Spirulina subsalsa]MCW6037094.1 DNA sulfur modification protein DndD [Spirulina subsalsa FACHB-351]
MLFKELVLQNFGPYVGRQVIDLSPIYDEELKPIILLGGMNGGGKTTLMDAIRLAFYGQRAQCSTRGNLNYSDFLEQCVSRQVKDLEETVIELAFEHIHDNDKVTFRIRRRWTRSPKNGKDELEIITDKWVGDKSLGETMTKTWDERVEQILPLGISNLFLFDGEQVKELAEQESPPSQVVEAIESLLGLELAERLATDLETLINRKRKNSASKKELETIEALEQKIDQLREEQEELEQEVKGLEREKIKAEYLEQQASDRFMTEGGKIAAEQMELAVEEKHINQQIEAKRQNLVQLAGDFLPLVLISPLLEAAHKQGRKELRVKDALIAQDVLLKRDEKLVAYLKDIALPSAKFKKIQAFLQEEQELIKQDLDPEFKSWLEVDAKTLAALDGVLTHKLPGQKEQARQQLGELDEQLEELTALEQKKQRAASPEAYKLLQIELQEAQKNLSQMVTEIEHKKKQVEGLGQTIKTLKKELEDYSRLTLDRKVNQDFIDSATKVQNTLTLFRERLTLKKLNKLEMEVTECFRYLLHKSDLVHRVAIEVDSFRISLYDPRGQAVPKHRLSAGEKQLLAIAFLWSLARVSGQNLPIAIDTPLGRLDSSHRNNLVERYFPAASNQVILLSTDTEIGAAEVEQLRDQNAIAREYLLEYNPKEQRTTIKSGYFF